MPDIKLAIGNLRPKKGLDKILAALKILQKAPTDEAHQPLVDLYNHYAANGPKRDPGAYTRRAILDALRPIALPEDVPMLLEAVSCYEFLPPGFKEDAVLLRVGALLILNELDGALAGYHATRLLVDGFTQEMSGEPAVTAVHVLESQSEILPVYQLVMDAAANPLPELLSECLRALTQIPVPIISGVVQKHGDSKHGVVQVGLYDLLINHEQGPQELDFLAGALVQQPDLDVFRYLIIALLSSGKPVLIALVVNTLRFETRKERISTALDTAVLFETDPDIAALAAQLREA